MQFVLDDKTIRAAVGETILTHLTPEKREEIIRSAIAEVLNTSQYGRSPLIEAFQAAARDVARQIVLEELAKPEYGFEARVREAVVVGWQKFIDDKDGRERMVTNIASAIEKAIVTGR
jgi:uncharacterized membrane protein YgcG